MDANCLVVVVAGLQVWASRNATPLWYASFDHTLRQFKEKNVTGAELQDLLNSMEVRCLQNPREMGCAVERQTLECTLWPRLFSCSLSTHCPIRLRHGGRVGLTRLLLWSCPFLFWHGMSLHSQAMKW